jgi:hypothetical protein
LCGSLSSQLQPRWCCAATSNRTRPLKLLAGDAAAYHRWLAQPADEQRAEGEAEPADHAKN